jgi:hypothetical protein
LITWDVSVDSTIARAPSTPQAHVGALTTGSNRPGVATERADHALGRSRGGWTTKLHLACEQGGKPLSMLLTAGHRADSPQFAAVLASIRVSRLGAGRPRVRPDRVIADRAYTSRGNRTYLRRRGIRACIPSKIDQDAHRRAKGSAGHPPSTPSSTGSVTPSSAASTGSNATEAWPLATTNWPSATKPPSTSPPSTSGYMHFETRPRTAVVVGAGRGIAGAFAEADASVIAVARTGDDLTELAGTNENIQPEVVDAAEDGVAERMLDRHNPEVLVLVAGAVPVMRPLHDQTWETFSVNWHADVKISFTWLRAALRKPLPPGSRVVVISSGAAFKGSPASGGYAGAKATQRFIAGYAPRGPRDHHHRRHTRNDTGRGGWPGGNPCLCDPRWSD